jgi:NADH-quinone oxidoreductase subunit G
MPTFLLDDREIEFNPGETVIAAAERSGVDIPHYCWHPGLSTAANCRMCLVEVLPPEGRPAMLLDVLRFDDDKGDYVLARKPKLQPACQLSAAAGMRIKSQTSEHAVEARAAVQEFLLLNHPVDCPICDQAGECRLQDYWLEHSGKKKRMKDEILHRPKAVDFGPTIVYDAERCIVCTRCVRFCDEVVGDHVLDKRERGNLGEIVLAPGRQLDHDYTLMTEHVCPVGALTSKDFRFKARVWFLRTVRSVCQGCATGCNSYTDFDPRNQTVYRHRPRENQEVNKYWMCDEGMLDYRRIHESRILAAKVGGKKSSVDDALNEAASRLVPVGKDKLAIVLSYSHSSEDNLALLELARALGVTQTYATGRPAGKGDHILRHVDKNPNRAGVVQLAQATLGAAPLDLASLANAVDAGSIGAVLALGSYVEDGGLAAKLKRVPVVALSTFEGAIVDQAAVVLPASSWAEADGTFVNAKGMAQVSEKAIQPQGDSEPAWRLVLGLASKLGVSLPFTKAKELEKVLSARAPKVSAQSTTEAQA